MSEKEFGCSHYSRKCSIIAPCCGKEYICRLCHNDNENHEINRYEIKEVKCLACDTRQKVQEKCSSCSITFGNYFCNICNLFDDKDKKQFHCDPCGLCRVGGRENFFHCSKCDLCLTNEAKDDHKCVEKASHANCPVCLEDLHTSVIELHIPSCRHIIHRTCYKRMLETGNYACPICNQSMAQMENVWQHLDEEIANTPMPDEYKNHYLSILCRDCHKNSRVLFHVLGLKCRHCGSYNTCGDDFKEEPVGAPGEGDSGAAAASEGAAAVSSEEGGSDGGDGDKSAASSVQEEAEVVRDSPAVAASSDREQPEGEEGRRTPAHGQVGDGEEAERPGSDGGQRRGEPSGGDSSGLPPRGVPEGTDNDS